MDVAFCNSIVSVYQRMSLSGRITSRVQLDEAAVSMREHATEIIQGSVYIASHTQLSMSKKKTGLESTATLFVDAIAMRRTNVFGNLGARLAIGGRDGHRRKRETGFINVTEG